MLSLVDDFEDAAAVIIALVNATPERFGALPSSIVKPPRPYPDYTTFPPTSLLENHIFVVGKGGASKYKATLRKPLNAQYTITGRRSFVYTARINPVPAGRDDDCSIVKFSYQVSTRSRENDLLGKARDAGVEHLPEVLGWDDLWTLKDSAEEVHRRRKAYMKRLGLELSDAAPIGEDRILRAIVYAEYFPIRELFAGNPELMPIMVNQMIDCEVLVSSIVC